MFRILLEECLAGLDLILCCTSASGRPHGDLLVLSSVWRLALYLKALVMMNEKAKSSRAFLELSETHMSLLDAE